MKNYKSYPKYKDSGIPWLGEIPEHWETSKTKHILFQKKKTLNPNLNCGSISFGNIVFKDNDRVPLETRATYQEILAGEFLINPLNLNFDLKSLRTGLSTIDVVVSTGYIVLQNNPKFNKRYLKWLLHQFDVSFMKTLGDGVRQTLSYNDFKNTRFPYISLPEQSAIANFLDYKLSKTNRFIRKKKQLIKLLNEQKAAIINQAVTKGLNPNAKMKDSDIEWLGEIPEHWEVRKLKYVAKVCNGSECDKQSEGLYPVYGSGGIFGYHSEYLYNKPSVLLGRKGTLNRPIYVDVPFWTVDTAFYTKIKEDSILPYYFYLACTTINFDYYSTKTALPSMTQTSLYDVKLGLPPLTEQQQIVSYIEQETARLNIIISKIEKEISLVEEFKTALIAEAVTGKIDVRDFVGPDFDDSYLGEEENDIDFENAEEHETIEE